MPAKKMRPATGGSPGKQMEESFETGMDEFFKAGAGNLYNNMKRTYDEYQQESLESIRTGRVYLQKVLSDALQHDNSRQNIANQALQNAVETANMVGKQAVRHGDIAIDRQWNVDEQGWIVNQLLKSETFTAAVAAAVAKAVDAAAKAVK